MVPGEVQGNANEDLKGLLSRRYQDIFKQSLFLLEVAFPHSKGDGSDNEKTFTLLRSKILRIGNDAVRELDDIFNSYVAFKLTEYKRQDVPGAETIVLDFKNNYKINRIKGEV